MGARARDDPQRPEPDQVLGPRYGTACLNHPEYRSYENAQITALLERYDFDALWIDMAFWTGVCICERCRERYRGETDDEFPLDVDWTSSTWARFQSARERWLKEWTLELFEVAHAVRPRIASDPQPRARGHRLGHRSEDRLGSLRLLCRGGHLRR